MTVSVIGTEEQASESGEPAAEEENEDETASSHPEAEDKTKQWGTFKLSLAPADAT